VWLAESTLGVNPVDSGFYAACAGLRARTQALEVVANNLASLTTTGYSSSQVDKRKVGKLAIAIQSRSLQSQEAPAVRRKPSAAIAPIGVP
jgi:flagellar basal body rod protein FlgG